MNYWQRYIDAYKNVRNINIQKNLTDVIKKNLLIEQTNEGLNTFKKDLPST